MNGYVLGLIGILAAGLVAIALIFKRWRKFSGNFSAAGVKMGVDASNDPPPTSPAVKVHNATSATGSLRATDSTGRGSDVDNVNIHKDIEVSSTPPHSSSGPKA